MESGEYGVTADTSQLNDALQRFFLGPPGRQSRILTPAPTGGRFGGERHSAAVRS
jgi:hypothetical protein